MNDEQLMRQALKALRLGWDAACRMAEEENRTKKWTSRNLDVQVVEIREAIDALVQRLEAPATAPASASPSKRLNEFPEHLSPKEASELLNLPIATLAVWRSTNRVVLPYFKLGGHVRYRRSDIERFITENMRNGAAVE